MTKTLNKVGIALKVINDKPMAKITINSKKLKTYP